MPSFPCPFWTPREVEGLQQECCTSGVSTCWHSMCIAGRTSSRTDAADPATPTKGDADPATARIQVDAKGKLPRTPRSMHCTILDAPRQQGNEEVPGCGLTSGGSFSSPRASAAPPLQPSSCPGVLKSICALQTLVDMQLREVH